MPTKNAPQGGRPTKPRHRLALAVAAGALVLAPCLLRAQPAAAARWDHIKTALFFTDGDVKALLEKPQDRIATLAYFAPLRISKFYLDNSSVDPASVATLREIAADLRSRGISVSGAVVPANRGPLCYNDPQDMALLEGRVKVLAQVFDEIIVDDWLFTNCTSPQSLAERGSQSWADYRSRLVSEQSKIHLIDAAKKVNPAAQVIIKYPNWYEGHRQNGYDVALQTPQFDGVSVGIETRQPATQDQHIPTYSGYVFQGWIGGDAGAKWRSAWLDNSEMTQVDFSEFAGEVWQAVLARAPEIIFWCAGELHPPNPSSDVYPALCEAMPDFDRLAGMLSGPARGIPFHLPLGAVGEYNIFGYLGAIGLPIAPRTAFPDDPKVAIFTRHSLRDPKLADELLARVRSGREVFLTWSLLQDLRGSELWRAFNFISDTGTVTSSTFRVREAFWFAKPVEATRPFTFPRIELSTWPYVREVGLVREDGDFGILLSAPYLEGRIGVLNMPDNSYDLLRLPEPVLNSIRRVFFDELGVRLLGPGNVALYPFGDRQYVLYNMNGAPAKVALHFPEGTPTQGWRERLHGESLKVAEVEEGREPFMRPEFHVPRETEVALTLLPSEIALVERP
ncbi:MAG: hypothetical protein ABSH26_17725 [Opitutaceae bacterium]|jgi:hypothetical protein